MKNFAREELTDHYIINCGFFRWKTDLQKSNTMKAFINRTAEYYVPWWERKAGPEVRGFMQYASRYYYSTFMDVQFPEASVILSDQKYPDVTSYMTSCFIRDVLCHLTVKDISCFQNITFQRKDREGNLQYARDVDVHYCDLYLYPEGTGIFALKSVILGDDEHPVNYSQVSDFLFAFREMLSDAFVVDGKEITSAELISEFVFFEDEENLFPCSFQENQFNNKLKSYLVIEGDIPVQTTEEREYYNRLLYGLGTVSPIGSIQKGGDFAPDPEYFSGVLSSHSFSMFKNWSVLALFDTFTVLFNKPQKHFLGSSFQNFEELYFPIYVHNLFLKYFSFTTNADLSEMGVFSKETKKIRDKFQSITSRFSFSHISYNVLPGELHNHIRNALDIEAELDQMYSKIESINTQINEKTENRTNIILTLLSVLALGSAFWDTSEWLQKLFRIPESIYTVFSLSFAGATLGLIAFVFLILRKKV
ncbi:MAG: hypothetical protein ACLFR1_04415 [Spirochaetia bacterium]